MRRPGGPQEAGLPSKLETEGAAFQYETMFLATCFKKKVKYPQDRPEPIKLLLFTFKAQEKTCLGIYLPVFLFSLFTKRGKPPL